MLSEENVPNERLRRARHLKGWTQSDLAGAVGTDFETISRWERGIMMPSAYFREQLCRVLERNSEELGFVQSLDEPLAPSSAPCVFLAAAYADAEREFPSQLKAHLQARGVTVLSSRTLRRQGAQDQNKVLQGAIRASQIVLLIASPDARSSRHVQRAVQIAGIYQSQVYAVWVDGERLQECIPRNSGEFYATFDVRERHDLQSVAEIAAALEEVIHAAKETVEDSATGSEPAALPEPRNPYKGLKAFHGEDRGDFFGRDKFIDELTQALSEILVAEDTSLTSTRLLAIIGPSGSGKSSVVMAGLLPRLQTGALPGSEHWISLDPIIPGNHPIEALALAIAQRLPDRSLRTIREDLDDDSTSGVHLLARLLEKQTEERVVLFIDQFEEVFTQMISEEERIQFLDLLVTAVSEPQGPIILVLTMRADFYDQPMRYPDLFHLIETHHSFVLPMNLKELRDVIEKPAGLPDVQVTFEGDLVSNLLFEMQEQAGALPLLQFTLDQLFQRRDGHQLTLQMYEEIGGVKGAVAKHAEITYNSLSSEKHRELARGLFLRLIDPGMTTQDTRRRRIPQSTLVMTNPKETAILEEILRVFTRARLLTTSTVSGIITVEVSHEAVIREWKRLSNWLEEAREDLLLLQRIQEDAAEWKRHEYSVDRLYRGSQLAEALSCHKRSLLNLDEEAFLQAGITEQAHQEALLAERQRQEVQQRKHYTRRTVLVGLAGGGLTMAALGVSAVLLQRKSSEQPPLPSVTFPHIYSSHSAAVTSVAWSPDGRHFASASADKTVRVWDASSAITLLIYTGHSAAVTSVAWSPDGKYLASASDDSTVRVWDTSSDTTLLTYQGHIGPVLDVMWSPDGKYLASAGADETVRVWDAKLRSGQMTLTYTGHTGSVLGVVWSPDGRRVASASEDETVRVWDASIGSTLLTYAGHTDSVLGVIWSPDGKYIASVSADETVRVWDASIGSTFLTYNQEETVVSVAWSPDGKHIASGAGNGEVDVRVWDASSGITRLIYIGHSAAVTSVAWSPDGKRLASASEDDTVQVWDATSGQTLLTYSSHTNLVISVAWSPDGKRLASASADKTVQVWDAISGQALLTYRGHTGPVESVAWSPDGKRLTSASDDSTARVWLWLQG